MQRTLVASVVICFALPLVAQPGCGHSASPPGTPPSASPANAEPESTVAIAPAPTPPPAEPTAAPGDLALPPGSAKAWNNAQSDGASTDTDRGVDDYRAIIQSNRDKFRNCYDATLAAHPGVAGRVVLHWVLNPDGSIKEVSVDKAASDIKQEDLERCMSGVLRTLKFPPSKKGKESTVNYPFTFTPGAKKR